MTTNHTIPVRDFTTIPGPRFKKSGDYSAEEFFESNVLPVIQQHPDDNFTIDFSGTWGYGPSFTSQLSIYIVDTLGKNAIERVSGIATDDPEVVERFVAQMKEYINDKH